LSVVRRIDRDRNTRNDLERGMKSLVVRRDDDYRVNFALKLRYRLSKDLAGNARQTSERYMNKQIDAPMTITLDP
jgi:hypothetical protein